eukprot:gene2489-3198_t
MSSLFSEKEIQSLLQENEIFDEKIQEMITKFIKKKERKISKEKIQEKLKTYFRDIKKLTETEKTDQNLINQEEEMNSIWIDLKEEVMNLLLENVGEFGLSLFEWEEVVRTSLNYIQTKERQYRRFPKRIIEKTLDTILPGAENGRSLVRFIIYQLSRLKNVNQQNMTSDEGENASQTQLHDRAARIIAYTISGIFLIHFDFLDLAQRYIIPIPTFELMKDDKIEKKVEKKTIILLTKNIINRKYKKVEEIPKSFLTISRTDNEELGPVNVKIPFYYENPEVKLKSLANKEKDLIERLEFLKRLKYEFNNDMNEEEKKKLSLVLSLHSMNQIKNLKSDLNIELPSNNSIIPIKDIESEYNKSLIRAIKRSRIVEKKFPSFFFEISSISEVNIKNFLKFKEKKLNVQIPFIEFKCLIEKGGIFHQTDIVQNLLNHIDSSNSIEILYDWVINGRNKENEESDHKLSKLLKTLIKHSKTKNGMLEIEEYCLEKLKKNPNSIGEIFVLEFMSSLNDTIESEKYNPEGVELHDEYHQNQKILRKGAYQFLKFAIKDQFNIEIEEPLFHEEEENFKIKKENYKYLIEKFQEEKPFEPIFSLEELMYQFQPPQSQRSEVYSTTNQRRKELFSETKKK